MAHTGYTGVDISREKLMIFWFLNNVCDFRLSKEEMNGHLK